MLLAIETSCDDTSVAVMDPRGPRAGVGGALSGRDPREVRGVVPEVASRAHTERATAVVREALVAAGIAFGDVTRVAVTVGPGLIGRCWSVCTRPRCWRGPAGSP